MTDGDATKVLGKDDILNADDMKTESVDVPEWGGEVIIKTLTARQKDAWEASIVKQGSGTKMNLIDMRARLVVVSIVDDQGKRVFADSDVGKLTQKFCKAVDRVFDAAQRLNKMTDDDVKDLEGNCEAGPAGD